MLMPPSEGERHGTHSGCLVNSIYMPRSVHADMGVLSQITENRKVEARKPLIFQDTVFEFYLEKATLRQSPPVSSDTRRRGRWATPTGA